MDVIFKMKEYMEVQQANEIFRYMNFEEQEQIFLMVQCIQIGVQMEKNRQQQDIA